MTATSKGRLHREILEMATVQRRLGIIDESSYREIALRQIRTRDRPTSGLMTGDEVAMPQDASEPRRHQATSKHGSIASNAMKWVPLLNVVRRHGLKGCLSSGALQKRFARTWAEKILVQANDTIASVHWVI